MRVASGSAVCLAQVCICAQYAHGPCVVWVCGCVGGCVGVGVCGCVGVGVYVVV